MDENMPLLPSIQEEPATIGTINDNNNINNLNNNNNDYTNVPSSNKNNVLITRQPSTPRSLQRAQAAQQQAQQTQQTQQQQSHNYKKNDIYNFSRSKQAILFAIMLFVNVLGPLSTEAQVPALQDIADDLNTTSQWVQLTITIYMLSFGASQLFFGTLSDMYGRRNTLLAGLVIYTLTNVGCALAPNVALLNVFRAIQAMGSGAGMVIVYAIARDVFSQNDRTRVLGILGGLRPIVIAASPIFGGAVTAFCGWRYIFWIIGGLSLALLVITYFLLPETRDISTVHITTVREYKDTVKILIKNKIFVGLVLISGAVYAGVFIMFNEFSFVMENRFNYSEFDTGLLCGLIVFGLMVGSLISIMLVRCFNPISVVCIGIIQIFFCGALLVLPLILYSRTAPIFIGMNEYWTLIPLFLYVSADGLMLPHLISTALEPFKAQAGTASALAGFWRFFSAAVIALIVSSSSNEHLMVLHIGTACMAVISGILYVFTLFRSDSSEFTASRDAEMRKQIDRSLSTKQIIVNNNDTNNNNNYDDTGVTVIADETEFESEYKNSHIHSNISYDNSVGNGAILNDETPLIKAHLRKPVTIQA